MTENESLKALQSEFESLYAPWRADISTGDKNTEECPFCGLPDEGDDREALVVARSESNYVLLNFRPYSAGHVLVIPYEHSDGYHTISPEIMDDHGRTLQATVDTISSAFGPDGMNTGANLGSGSGGSVDGHLHTHVIPRWQNDTDFLPLVGGASVITSTIEATYEALHAGFYHHPDQAGQTETGAVRLDFDV